MKTAALARELPPESTTPIWTKSGSGIIVCGDAAPPTRCGRMAKGEKLSAAALPRCFRAA
ncbi:MAG: hypothetical protein ACLS69_03220 [Butyricicoccus sp.]